MLDHKRGKQNVLNKHLTKRNRNKSDVYLHSVRGYIGGRHRDIHPFNDSNFYGSDGEYLPIISWD